MIKKVVISCFSLLVLFFLVGFISLKIYEAEGRRAEVQLREALSSVPQMKLEKDPWWDKSLLVWADITNKGKATFWYTKEGEVSGFIQIGAYQPQVICYYTSGKEAYTSFFGLQRGHKLSQWFPFEVNTLQDVVNRYDQIADIFSKLSSQSEMVPTFTDAYKGQPISCKLLL